MQIRTLHNVNLFLLASSAELLGKHYNTDPPLPEAKGTPDDRGQTDAPTATQDEDPVTYSGSCHCGRVKLKLLTKPLSRVEVKEDHCSICVRTAFLGVYPHQSEVSITGSGDANEHEYEFGRKFTGHLFCRTCGVHTHMNIYGPPKAVVESWPEAHQASVRKNLELAPVNVRVLDGVEWEELHVARSDEGTEGYDPEL